MFQDWILEGGIFYEERVVVEVTRETNRAERMIFRQMRK